MCHHHPGYVKPFAQTVLLANVHCSESLVWFEASGFCYTINTGSSLGLLLDTLLSPCVMEILQLWFSARVALHKLQQFIDGLDVGVGRRETLDLGPHGS